MQKARPFWLIKADDFSLNTRPSGEAILIVEILRAAIKAGSMYLDKSKS
ncbi:MAG: hypothetical protein HY313_06945 [Acidobacteria bacterium]|nr:hypothetical protein [Acidobacteriota bacterium]